jgi:UDP-N-acetylglucosamine--N-acetylmuramyl-(pentapeptide) pyrophosphoryl-undecaprenol N-acetylglucosamine transferase
MMNEKKIRALIAAGGTGGHLFPAMAVAEQLNILTNSSFHAEFVGTPHRIESRAVPNAGYHFTSIPITGFKGILSFDSLMLPYRIYKSQSICRKIIKEKKINVVICTGAYISYPAGLAAVKEGIPLVLMESNLTPGKTIKMLSSKAQIIITAFPESEKYYPDPIAKNIMALGNPVRKNIFEFHDKQEARKSLHLHPDKFTILIFGGSLGAKSINDVALKLTTTLSSEEFQFIWQTGKNFSSYPSAKENVWSSEFIDDMASAYSAADLVISRSGATTVSELCAVGKPSVLVPYPSASNNEQELNAKYLSDSGAAYLVYDDAIQDNIINITKELYSDKDKLSEMGRAAKALATPQASIDTAKAIIALID